LFAAKTCHSEIDLAGASDAIGWQRGMIAAASQHANVDDVA
jgi:hypothetical protein